VAANSTGLLATCVELVGLASPHKVAASLAASSNAFFDPP
jgi:hypothetical protein